MSKTAKIVWGAVVLVVLIVVISVASTRRPADNTPIKIGATLALTGTYANIAEAEKDGMTLAIEEINKAGGVNGRQLQLIAEDNQGDTKLAVSGVNKLLDTDKVDLLYSAFTGITSAVSPIASARNRVLFYSSTVRTFAKDNPLTFRDYWDSDASGALSADIAHMKGYKSLKFLTEVSDQCKEFETAMTEKAASYGIQIVQKETYLPTDKDMLSQVTKLKGSPAADAIILCSWRSEPIVMKDIQQLDMRIPTIHLIAPFLSSADTAEMRQMYERFGVISTWYGFTKDSTDQKQSDFIKNYKARFGMEPLADSSYVYDDVYAMADAVRKCGAADDQKCLADKLSATDYVGVGGRLSFTKDRSSSRPLYAITVVNGEWQRVTVSK